MTTDETGTIMEILNAAYPRFYANSSQDEKIKALALWAEMFREYPVKAVAYAVKTFIAEDTKGFPPAIGQIMERVRFLTEKSEMTAEEAWELVYRAICRSGWHAEEEFEKLPPNVKKVVHSPGQLQAWGLDPQFNAGVESSNFKKAYRAVVEREKRVATLPEDIKVFIAENATKQQVLTERNTQEIDCLESHEAKETKREPQPPSEQTRKKLQQMRTSMCMDF